ncbi:MAG: HdeD family acid-resistance protein [Acidiferrobacter sp.]
MWVITPILKKEGAINTTPSPLTTIIKGEQHVLGKFTLVVAILLIVIGILGVMSPVILSAVTDGVLAAILIIGGLTWAGHSYRLHAHGLADWLKPLLLLATGAIMVALPAAGIASIGLLFTLYFAIDAYRNFTRPKALGGIGRGWFIFSGIVDIIIAVLFIVTWPQGSLVLVGIFVGVNLIFDGIILMMVRNTLIGSPQT